MNINHSLYYSKYCYFCQKVLAFLSGNDDLNVELRSMSESKFAMELMQGGGKTQVPCLRIESDGKDQWLYESDDIVNYLKAQG